MMLLDEDSKDSVRIWFRRLFRRTPPQRESGWICLADRKPAKEDANFRRLVEVYDAHDDLIFQAYEWSLQNYPLKEARARFWRPLTEMNDIGLRSVEYFERSQSIFG